MKTESIMLHSDGSEMQTFIARAESPKSPGLILFQEAFGVTEHIKDVCERFAKLGYTVAAPELFHRTAPPGFTVSSTDWNAAAPHFQAVNADTIASDATAVFEWLKNDSHVDSSRIGAIGFCLGGRCAFISNGKLPLRAAVSFYGGGINTLLDLVPTQSAPILFFWGGLDTHITPELLHATMDAMTKASKPFINVEISDANHAFFNDQRPAYGAVAAKHAWALTTSFLGTHLKGA
ncbi:MAG TPA: dienelactone hydrolase family protein [Candidatus Kapabacteria bacterium]